MVTNFSVTLKNHSLTGRGYDYTCQKKKYPHQQNKRAGVERLKERSDQASTGFTGEKCYEKEERVKN